MCSALAWSLPSCAQPGPVAELDVRSFGAVGDGVSDDTAAIQRAIDTAYNQGVGLRLPAGTFRVSGLKLVIARGNLQSAFRMVGEGSRITRLMKYGSSSSPILQFDARPLPTETNLYLADFSVDGQDINCHGIRLVGVAHAIVARVVVERCNHALDGSGALLCLFDNCTLQRSRVGAYFRKTGNVHANALTLRGCSINLNRRMGLDFGEGSMLRLRDCQFENNGTPGDSATGAIVLRSGVSSETGYAVAVIDGCWLEQNFGRAIHIERDPGLFLTVRDTKILSSEGGRAFVSDGAGRITLDNLLAPSGGDAIDVRGGPVAMRGGIVGRLAGDKSIVTLDGTTVGNP